MGGVIAFRDLVGQRYGQLTVLSYVGVRVSPKNGNEYHLWSCRCDCGVIKDMRTDSLIYGWADHCGCKSPNAFVDRAGERYGKLVILSYAGIHVSPNGNRNRQWLCQCDCGNTKVLQFRNISNGAVRSCGCLNKEIVHNQTHQRKAKGIAAFNQLYASYKKSARQRNLPFDLSPEQFRILTQRDCVYCGLPPSLRASVVKKTYGDYIYTGIDRIDNSKGYTFDNVRPCCKQCNRAKMDISEQEFIDWIQRLVQHSNECKRGEL